MPLDQIKTYEEHDGHHTVFRHELITNKLDTALKILEWAGVIPNQGQYEDFVTIHVVSDGPGNDNQFHIKTYMYNKALATDFTLRFG